MISAQVRSVFIARENRCPLCANTASAPDHALMRGGALAGLAVALPILDIGKPRPVVGNAHQATRLIGVALSVGLARHPGSPFPEIRRLGHSDPPNPTHRIRLSGGSEGHTILGHGWWTQEHR